MEEEKVGQIREEGVRLKVIREELSILYVHFIHEHICLKFQENPIYIKEQDRIQSANRKKKKKKLVSQKIHIAQTYDPTV